ncbi:unnamed protein product [Sphagnum jensenii]|uniref:Uncharacterized protein n=1 Tax=Sphagnum jensenii TaxID=128206 RepID=A0ABP0VM69_9BRYO
MRETRKGGTNDYRISLTLGALQNFGRFMESVLRQLQKYGLIWHQAAMFVRTCIDVMNAHRKALRKPGVTSVSCFFHLPCGFVAGRSLEVQVCFITCVNTT